MSDVWIPGEWREHESDALLLFSNVERDPDRIRIQRRFRGHVQTLSNPRGKIVRLPCQLCPLERARDRPSEFHHLDYRPENCFRGVWVCPSCHRRIDHSKGRGLGKPITHRGTLRFVSRPGWPKLIKAAMICDYSSLVNSRSEKWVEGAPQIDYRGDAPPF